MIKKFLILSLTISLSQIAFCQQGWYQLTSGTSQSLASVYFTSADTGYCAGVNGIILKTTNGGMNWLNLSSGTSSGLSSIYFVNNNTGYIVGGTNSQCTILKTTNAGLNWIQQIPGTNNSLESVYFLDSNTGYATGTNSTVAKTTNGGMNWFVQIGNYGDLPSVYFIDANTGYACGFHGQIIKTINGGFSWNILFSNTSILLYSVFFPNASTGCVAGGTLFPGEYIILRTTDSGNTWINQSIPGSALYTLYFNDVNTGYAAGGNGKILKTTNGGVNWIQQFSNTNSYLNEIFFPVLNTGYCVGGYGVILKTTNGGLTGLEHVSNDIPKEYELFQNYPNPFNPNSRIKFQISKLSDVKLTVFNVLGKEIKVIVNEQLRPGIYEADFNAANYSSGIYFYKLETKDFTDTKKMILVK